MHPGAVLDAEGTRDQQGCGDDQNDGEENLNPAGHRRARRTPVSLGSGAALIGRGRSDDSAIQGPLSAALDSSIQTVQGLNRLY